MSLQWTFVATFLYSEVIVLVLLLLPFIAPSRWQRIFKSRILNSIASYANLYFNVLIVVLVILFVDSIREVRKYSLPTEQVDLKNNPLTVDNYHMKLFRAQRNFYIAGFALFLWLVLRRIVTLISTEASLEAKHSAALKQAESATAVAQQLMDEKAKASEDKENKDNAEEESDILRKTAKEELVKMKEEVNSLKKELWDSNEKLQKATLDLDVMRKQAEATNTEYDRLLDEHSLVQKKLAQLEYSQAGAGGEDVKKDN